MVTIRLKDLRSSRRLSQKDFAQALNVSQQTVASWESGRTEPSNTALKDIADYFNVSADYLLGRDVAKAPALSEEQTTVLGVFDTLNTEGRDLFMGILRLIKLSYSKHKQKSTSVVQKNSGGTNFIAMSGNNYNTVAP